MGLADLLIGVLLGLVTSLVGWWLIARALTPNLVISSEISKLADETEKAPWRYRVKLANVSRWWVPDWPVLDTNISASLAVRGLRDSRTWTIYDIPMGNLGELAFFEKNHVWRLRIYDMRVDQADFLLLPPAIRERIRSAEIQLEELLGLGDAARLRVVASGAHGYTFARKAIVGVYEQRDVVPGPFARGRGKKSVVVVRDERETAVTPLPSDLPGGSAGREDGDAEPPQGVPRTPKPATKRGFRPIRGSRGDRT